MPVKAITLDRLATGFTDRMFERRRGLLLWSGGASHVKDFFLQDGAVQIIHAVAERHLSERQSQAHPIGRKMVDVIEVNATDGQITKLLNRRSRLYVREHGRLRFESKWNKPGEATGLILQLAQLVQMIDAMRERLDVPVKHGAGASATHFVPGPVDVEPFGSGFLAATDFIAHNRIENFRAAAGYGAETGFA